MTTKSNGAVQIDGAKIKTAFENFITAKEGAGMAQLTLLTEIAACNPKGVDIPKEDAQKMVDAALKPFHNMEGTPAFTSAKAEVSRAVAALRCGTPRWEIALRDAQELKDTLGRDYGTNKIVVAAGIAGAIAKGKYDKEVFLAERVSKFQKDQGKKEEAKSHAIEGEIDAIEKRLRELKITAITAKGRYDTKLAEEVRIMLAKLKQSVRYGAEPAATVEAEPKLVKMPTKPNGKGRPANAVLNA
jgi:hypothetical protein